MRTQIGGTRKESSAHKVARISTWQLVGLIQVGLRRLTEKEEECKESARREWSGDD